jgi:hypothetical protein
MKEIKKLVGVFRGEDPRQGSRPGKEAEPRLGLGPRLRSKLGPSLEMDGVRERKRNARVTTLAGSTHRQGLCVGVIHS